MITEELMANLTDEQNKKMDSMAKQLKALAASIAALTVAFKGAAPTPAAAATTTGTNATATTHKARHEAYKLRLQNAPTCIICGKKHMSIATDKCWELPANAASRPAGWTSSKTA
jgi:hypothetical protein